MKRIRLTFSRNKSEETKSYRMFRSSKESPTRGDQMIMEIAHLPLPKPIKIENETLTRVEPNVYYCIHPSVMPDEVNYPSEVFLNGVSLKDLGVDFSVSYDDGYFYFSTSFADTDVLTATYYADAIQVYDTDDFEQEGVIYHGPAARDRSAVKEPKNFSIYPDVDRNRLMMTWEKADTSGQDYYYRMEAVDVHGNFSVLSEEAITHLHEGIGTAGYLIERSLDNINWHTISKQVSEDYTEYMPTRNPPGHILGLSHILRFEDVNNVKIAHIDLAWAGVHEGMPFKSGVYRVGAYSTFGVLGAMSSTIGPIYFYPQPKKLVVRIKENVDGTLPTFDGNDASTIAEIPITDLTFTCAGLDINKEYSIAIYAVDGIDQASPAAGVIVDTTTTP